MDESPWCHELWEYFDGCQKGRKEEVWNSTVIEYFSSATNFHILAQFNNWPSYGFVVHMVADSGTTVPVGYHLKGLW